MINRFKAFVGGSLFIVVTIATWNSNPMWLAILMLVGGVGAVGTAIFKQDWPE